MYRVLIEPKAQKSLDALDRRDRVRVAAAILRLADGPFGHPNVKALTGGGFWLRWAIPGCCLAWKPMFWWLLW